MNPIDEPVEIPKPGKPPTFSRSASRDDEKVDPDKPNEAERKAGFKLPYRDAVVHGKCGIVSLVPKDVADYMARSPGVVDRLRCTSCRGTFALKEFAWNGDPKRELDGAPKPKDDSK